MPPSLPEPHGQGQTTLLLEQVRHRPCSLPASAHGGCARCAFPGEKRDEPVGVVKQSVPVDRATYRQV